MSKRKWLRLFLRLWPSYAILRRIDRKQAWALRTLDRIEERRRQTIALESIATSLQGIFKHLDAEIKLADHLIADKMNYFREYGELPR